MRRAVKGECGLKKKSADIPPRELRSVYSVKEGDLEKAEEGSEVENQLDLEETRRNEK